MAKFMWNNQYISSSTQGDKTIYPTGSFPRYSPVSGIGGATPNQLGCCEQLDQDGYAILLAWMTGLTDPTTYGKIKMVANHIQTSGPDTSERWEEQSGKSPSSLSAMLGGLQAAADIARQNGDTASAKSWEGTADSWLASLPGWTFTTTGYWGGNSGHGAYYERIDKSSNPNDDATLHFDEGDFREHDVVDFGFLDLVRLGLSLPGDKKVSDSLAPSAQASDKNSTVQVTIQNGSNGDVYFRRYNHDNYGENNTDCKGWPAGGANRFGRLWPVLSGERGEYEIANGRLASVYLQSMADATNDGYFVPEQIWDRQDVSCFNFGRPTGSAAPLNWAEGQYLRLAQSMDATYNLETPTVVKAKYRGAGSIHGKGAKCVSDAGGSTTNGSHIQLSTCSGSDAQSWTWNSETGTLQVLGKCMDITGGGIANGTKIQLWDCNGTGSQEWRWRKQTSLVNPQSGRCLDTGNGNQLQISECKETPSQVWYP
jgi:glucoamylase